MEGNGGNPDPEKAPFVGTERPCQFVRIVPASSKFVRTSVYSFFWSKFVWIGRIWPKVATEEQGTSEMHESKV